VFLTKPPADAVRSAAEQKTYFFGCNCHHAAVCDGLQLFGRQVQSAQSKTECEFVCHSNVPTPSACAGCDAAVCMSQGHYCVGTTPTSILSQRCARRDKTMAASHHQNALRGSSHQLSVVVTAGTVFCDARVQLNAYIQLFQRYERVRHERRSKRSRKFRDRECRLWTDVFLRTILLV